MVVIESLATGTPVFARRDGALPEIVEHGGDRYLVDDLSEAELAVRLLSALDRADIRRRAPQRFSAARMADDYERVYRRLPQPSAGGDNFTSFLLEAGGVLIKASIVRESRGVS